MGDKILALKASTCAIIVLLSDLFTWQLKLVVLMAAMMALDFVTGTIAGALTVGLSSKIARKGIATKFGYFAVIGASALSDCAMSIFAQHISGTWQWKTVFVPLACGWYIITDAISILENVVNMGAPVPEWLVKVLRITKEKLDNVKSGE